MSTANKHQKKLQKKKKKKKKKEKNKQTNKKKEKLWLKKCLTLNIQDFFLLKNKRKTKFLQNQKYFGIYDITYRCRWWHTGLIPYIGALSINLGTVKKFR